MKQSFPLEVFNGHLIIDCDGHQVLVDTGSPITFGCVNPLTIMGEDYPCYPSIMGFNIQSVIELLGRDIDAILGMDILNDYSMVVDCQQGLLTISDGDESFLDAASMPIQLTMNYVTTQTRVADKSLRFIIDTGAQLSYINPEHIQGQPSIGQRDDFHPIMGRYQVTVYDINIHLAGVDLQAQCGASPALVQQLIAIFDADGIIGYDLFASRKVVLDFPEKTLYVGQS